MASFQLPRIRAAICLGSSVFVAGLFDMGVAKAQRGLAALEVAQTVQRASLHYLIDQAASAAGVPRNVAHALVKRESGYRVNAVGKAGEIGLVQIKLSTARGLGFRGTRSQLFDPRTNLTYGMKYAALALKCGGIHLYQRGVGKCGARR